MNTNTTCGEQDQMLNGDMSTTGLGKILWVAITGEESEKTTLVRASDKNTHS